MKKILLLIFAGQMVGLTGCANTQERTRTVYRNPPTYNTQQTYAQQPTYTQPSTQDETNKKILKQGLMGAAVGAISAEASGGKAGTGALVGAGTNVLGGALFDILTTPQQPQPTQYAPYVNQWVQENPNNNRVVRKYDSNGNIVSEEVFTR